MVAGTATYLEFWQSQFKPLSAKLTKWPNTVKQTNLSTNCLSVFDHFGRLALKGLSQF